MEFLKEEILSHFNNYMAPTILRLQQNNQPTCIPVADSAVSTMDDLGEELALCCLSLHVYDVSQLTSYTCKSCMHLQVWKFMRTDLMHLRQKVLTIRPENTPGLRSSTVHYIDKLCKNGDLGLKAKKDFLVSRPTTTITKVIITPYRIGLEVQLRATTRLCIPTM